MSFFVFFGRGVHFSSFMFFVIFVFCDFLFSRPFFHDLFLCSFFFAVFCVFFFLFVFHYDKGAIRFQSFNYVSEFQGLHRARFPASHHGSLM